MLAWYSVGNDNVGSVVNCGVILVHNDAPSFRKIPERYLGPYFNQKIYYLEYIIRFNIRKF